MNRAPRANPNDTRGIARSVNVLREQMISLSSSGLTTADVQTLIDAALASAAAAESSSTTEETEVTSESATWQFELSASGTDYGYASYGIDGDWEAHRWDADSLDTQTGVGTKPTALSDFTDLSWPIPAP